MKQARSKKCKGGCKGTHRLICRQEGCALLQAEAKRNKYTAHSDDDVSCDYFAMTGKVIGYK